MPEIGATMPTNNLHSLCQIYGHLPNKMFYITHHLIVYFAMGNIDVLLIIYIFFS